MLPSSLNLEPDQNAIFNNHFSTWSRSLAITTERGTNKRGVHVYIGQEQGENHVIIIIA